MLIPGVDISANMPNYLKEPERFRRDNGNASLVWTVHLARHEPWKLLACVLACFVAALIGYAVIKNPFPVIITAAVLLASISDFLLPVTYRVGPKGASSTSILFRRTIRWEEVKACYLDNCGIKLSSIGHPSKREAYRGLYLRFGDNRDEIVQAVKTLRNKSDD